jgi:hypothetical protein
MESAEGACSWTLLPPDDKSVVAPYRMRGRVVPGQILMRSHQNLSGSRRGNLPGTPSPSLASLRTHAELGLSAPGRILLQTRTALNQARVSRGIARFQR